ncbi:MAG TPA: hypothetical protein VI455_12220 [Terriglobia bacterium]
MAHEGLLTVFVIVTALAVAMQAAILFAIYRSLSQLIKAVARIDAAFKEHLNPVLGSIQAIAAAAREPVGTILSNFAEISVVLRQRTLSADALAAEAINRARTEIIRVDELMSRIVLKVDRASEAVERGVLVPVREISAVMAGFRKGLEFFLGRRRPPARGERSPNTPHEEQLFI